MKCLLFLNLTLAFSIILFGGCNTAEIAGSTVGATLLGAQAPGSEIQQIYYLGVFDPMEQIPPQVYRIRVHGQASAISATNFSSGWVPADVIDSLTSKIQHSSSGVAEVTGTPTPTPGQTSGSFLEGRKLVLFGPEGFREAPENHRLVIVMGSSPQKFFSAINNTLTGIASVNLETSTSDVSQKILNYRNQLLNDRKRLLDLQKYSS